MAVYEFEIPVRTVSEANVREHWGKASKRAKEQRFVSKLLTIGATKNEWSTGAKTITLTRIGEHVMDDDNLARACKHVRDGIADALHMNDGDPRLSWRYEQEPVRRRQREIPVEGSVRVRIEE